MADLQVRFVTKEIEQSSFDCGVDSINQYIKQSYFPLLLQHAYTFQVSGNGIVLGYYQVLFREIELNDFPEDISDFQSDVKEQSLSAVHIRFIAVDKRYQGNRIGTAMLQMIVKSVMELSVSWPVRVITIDAVNHLTGWYEKIGFKRLLRNTPGQEGVTSAMYIDCMHFSDELEAYICESM